MVWEERVTIGLDGMRCWIMKGLAKDRKTTQRSSRGDTMGPWLLLVLL
jgi:hypothetical protein